MQLVSFKLIKSSFKSSFTSSSIFCKKETVVLSTWKNWNNVNRWYFCSATRKTFEVVRSPHRLRGRRHCLLAKVALFAINLILYILWYIILLMKLFKTLHAGETHQMNHLLIPCVYFTWAQGVVIGVSCRFPVVLS